MATPPTAAKITGAHRERLLSGGGKVSPSSKKSEKPAIEHDMKASRSRCPNADGPSPGPELRRDRPTDIPSEDPGHAESKELGTFSLCNASPTGAGTQQESHRGRR